MCRLLATFGSSLAVTGRNVLISGDPRSGKSWVGGLLCEQLILHGYSVCVIDPEGDYASLEALPRVTSSAAAIRLHNHTSCCGCFAIPIAS